MAAHVQLGMCAPTWEAQEHRPQDSPEYTDVVDSVIEVRDGYLLAPDRPGLGSHSMMTACRSTVPESVDLSHTARREDGAVAIR